MKKLLFLAVVVVLFVISIKIGNKLMVSYLEIEKPEETVATPSLLTKKEKNYIKESGEIQATDLYHVAGGNQVENNDFEIEMTLDKNSNLFYKAITNLGDYKSYQENFNLPELDESDFQKYFVIIVYNNIKRDLDETDLYISKVYSEESKTYVIMKQKDNATTFAINNIFYAIVEKSELGNSISVEIEK